MSLKKHSLICVIILLTLFASCKKYPDGPLLSLRTKEHRLVGTWDVESFMVNGNDSTAYLKSQPYYGKYEFQEGESGVGNFIYMGNSSIYNKNGHWAFENRKTELTLSLQNTIPSTSVGPYGAAIVTWEIRRLKEKELWLKTTYYNNAYFVKFKQP